MENSVLIDVDICLINVLMYIGNISDSSVLSMTKTEVVELIQLDWIFSWQVQFPSCLKPSNSSIVRLQLVKTPVHFLLRYFSLLKSILDFKTEKPSQLLFNCEKVYLLKSSLVR